MNLLSKGSANTKTNKNSMETFYLSLLPANMNSYGKNLCTFSTKECRTMCLQYTGRGVFSNVKSARLAKTDFYVSQPKEFLTQLYSELNKLNSKGKKIAVRLNMLSDIDWESEFQKHLGISLGSFTHIQFYDYTKSHFKVLENTLCNYHLTYSFSGYNWKIAEQLLKDKKANIAVVFKNQLPLQYKGYEVINGDLTDERFLDKKGVIVGLKYKVPHGVPYVQNKFVVDEEK
jgi:hypothetical protein